MKINAQRGTFKREMFQHGVSGLLLILFIMLALGSATTEGAVKAETYYEEGKKRAADENWGGALASFSQAIELDPNFANAYFERGSMLFRLNRLEGALSDFSKVIELEPKNISAYFNRGLIYIAFGNAEAYTNVFGYSTDAVGTSDVSQLNKALDYFNRALSDFSKASETTNSNIQQKATERIAEAQKKKGEVEKVIAASTAQNKAREETNRYDPSKFTVVPSDFTPADYTPIDLFKAVANSKNLKMASSKEEAMVNHFQSGFTFGQESYFFEYVSDLTFVRQNGTDITFSSDDKAITQNMSIDQRSGLQAGQKVRVYYEVTRSPLTTWDVVAIERR